MLVIKNNAKDEAIRLQMALLGKKLELIAKENGGQK